MDITGKLEEVNQSGLIIAGCVLCGLVSPL